LFENSEKDSLSRSGISILFEENWFNSFNVNITEIIAPESLENMGKFSESVVFEMFVHGIDELFKTTQNPSVSEGEGFNFD